MHATTPQFHNLMDKLLRPHTFAIQPACFSRQSRVCKQQVGALAEGAAACAARAIQPINAEAPLGLPAGPLGIRCFSIYDQRATSTRAPPQGFFVIVRFFVVRNISPTLPDAGRQVKGPYLARTSKHRWIRGLRSKSLGSVFAEMSRTS